MIHESMQDAEFKNLREMSWRRALTPTERERLRELLAARPDWRASWDEEASLNALLRRMPTVAVSTNFTARAVEAARRLPPKRAWQDWLEFPNWLPTGWAPRLALGCAMVCCGMISSHEYESFCRAQEAQRVIGASRLAVLPSIDWLENFDTINRMNKVKVADDDLLTVLQ
jgi:hypothetical protein